MNPVHALLTQVLQAETLQQVLELVQEAPPHSPQEISTGVTAVIMEQLGQQEAAALERVATALWRGFHEAPPLAKEEEAPTKKSRPKKKARDFEVTSFLEELKEQCQPPEEAAAGGVNPAQAVSMEQLLNRMLAALGKSKNGISDKLLRGLYIATQRQLSQPWSTFAETLDCKCKDPASCTKLRDPLKLFKLVTESRLHVLRYLQPQKTTLTTLLEHSKEVCEAIAQLQVAEQAFWYANAPATLPVTQAENTIQVVDLAWLCP